MNKLTTKAKSNITTDWMSLFPQFGIIKPMWLGRRIGPILQGLLLERDSSNEVYRPAIHLHSLCRVDSDISLSLIQRLHTLHTDAIDRISVQSHERRYRDAAERLAGISLLPLVGDITIDQVLAAQKCYPESSWDYTRNLAPIMEDAVAFCTWLGLIKRARDLIDLYRDEIGRWPSDILQREGGSDQWLKKLDGMIDSPDSLRNIANEQIVALKLQHLPVSQLRP